MASIIRMQERLDGKCDKEERGYRMLTKKRMIHNIILMAATLFIAVSFYVVCGVNSDDAGTYVWLREHFELGEVHHSLKEYLNPWFAVAVTLYKLNIGNTGADLLARCYSVWFFFVLIYDIKNINEILHMGREKNSWLLFLAIFIMMPSAAVNRYHLPVIFAALLLLWAADEFITEHSAWALIVSIAYVLYTSLFTADKALVLMEVVTPIGLYGVIWCMQKKESALVNKNWTQILK